MKIPSEPPYTKNVQLRPEQSRMLQATVRATVAQTLEEYEQYVHLHARTLPKQLWKEIKRREHLVIYRARSNATIAVDEDEFTHTHSSSSSHSHSHSHDDSNLLTPSWSRSKLLGVGAIVGTLEDVMFGIVAPDRIAMRVRSLYVDDGMVSSDVLSVVEGPTFDDPYRFVTLKWRIKHHLRLLPGSAPHEHLYVEGTGLQEMRDGVRVGYRVMQSVDLPQCGDIPGIKRARILSCSIFRQLPNGRVDVYITKFADVSRDLTAHATAMTDCWKSVWCAQNKKLDWMRSEAQLRWVRNGGKAKSRVTMTHDHHGHHCCALCRKVFRTFNSTLTCQVCSLMVCSRCHVARKLAHVLPGGHVTERPEVFCLQCSAQSLRVSALEVARRVHGLVHDDDHDQKAAATEQHAPQSRSEDRKTTTLDSTTRWHSEDSRRSTVSTSLEDAATRLSPQEVVPEEDVDELVVQSADDWARDHQSELYAAHEQTALSATTSAASTPASAELHRQQLWLQMNQLCLAAEKTFRITQRNAALNANPDALRSGGTHG
ncbi:hypothetical protein PINS_up006632 [Pythium insidiosum]|nr:hypothetical protein PINS_up006632 [Pythium insidiosum]